MYLNRFIVILFLSLLNSCKRNNNSDINSNNLAYKTVQINYLKNALKKSFLFNYSTLKEFIPKRVKKYEKGNYLVYLVIKYDCTTCFEDEMINLKKVIKNKNNLLILSNFKSEREINVFKNYYKFANVFSIDNKLFKNLTTCYFVSEKGRIKKPFFPSIKFPNISLQYLKYIDEKYLDN